MGILGKAGQEWDAQHDAGGELADMLATSYEMKIEYMKERERMDTFEELARCCREEEECPATLMTIHSDYDGTCPHNCLCNMVKAKDWEVASHIEGMLDHIGALECCGLE